MARGGCCALICTIFFPPFSVWLIDGCGVCLLLNFFLTFLCIVPGQIHACVLIFMPGVTSSAKQMVGITDTSGGSSTKQTA